ncbi:MAG: hypothetical protein WC076_12535 [Terrimicrobiaceae bacterium]
MPTRDEPVPGECRGLAEKYVWWKPPDEVLRQPEFFLGHVMNRATWEDQGLLERYFPAVRLRAVLREAEAGIFDPASWHYWHYRLGWTDVPALPRKNLSL